MLLSKMNEPFCCYALPLPWVAIRKQNKRPKNFQPSFPEILEKPLPLMIW
jgi:hypothetical protein